VTPLLALSLRQGMLSQRMAKLYLLRLGGDRSRSPQVDIDQTHAEFRTALQALAGDHELTPRARDNLDLARTQWLFYEGALRDPVPSPEYPRHVATTSERITQVMEEMALVLAPAPPSPWLGGACRVAYPHLVGVPPRDAPRRAQ
jgi:hypothetical protein